MISATNCGVWCIKGELVGFSHTHFFIDQENHSQRSRRFWRSWCFFQDVGGVLWVLWSVHFSWSVITVMIVGGFSSIVSVFFDIWVTFYWSALIFIKEPLKRTRPRSHIYKTKTQFLIFRTFSLYWLITTFLEAPFQRSRNTHIFTF